MASQELMDLLATVPDKPFSPYVDYSKKADAITCRFKPDADYSKRLTDHVTLFLSLDTHEIVGCRIKGVKELLEDLPNFIRVNHRDVELSVLFWSFRGHADCEVRQAFNQLAKDAGHLTVQPA